MPLFAEFYHRNRLNSDMEYRVGLGYATIVGASRDISNCINCFSSDFDLEGGGYLLAAMGKNVGEKSTVGLMARQYMSGDLDNSLVLWWRVNTNR